MGAEAPIELRVAGHELVLDVYNYRGPAKSFWEHRSQGGPFYQGNVRNAVILEVAEKAEFDGIAAFRAHIAAASVADSVDDDYGREIVYASGDSTLSLRYSLWDMNVIERKHDGTPYAPPLGRAGTVDGTGRPARGPQWVQSRDALIELGGAKLMAGRTPKWLFADAGSGRCVFVNPSDEHAPVWLETAENVVECDEFAFGRMEMDRQAGTLTVEASDEIGAIRLGGIAPLRLIINGQDVTDAMRTDAATGMREFGGL
jgi:hypothetical protein